MNNKKFAAIMAGILAGVMVLSLMLSLLASALHYLCRVCRKNAESPSR